MTDREREALVLKYRGLPLHILNKLSKRNPHLMRHKEDLLQEGQVGLCIAAQKFDPNMGASFMTYAYYWVTDRIRRAAKKLGRVQWDIPMDNEGNIRLDEYDGRDFYSVSVCVADADQDTRTEHFKLAKRITAKLNEMRRKHGNRNVEILYRRLIADNKMGEKGAQHSYRSIGEDMGLTQERVRQISNELRPEFEEWMNQQKEKDK